MTERTPEAMFEDAVVATGPAYRELETQLRRHPDTAAWLARTSPPTDPLAALLRMVIERWIADPTEFDAVLALLAGQPALVEGTPIPAPIPVAVAEVVYLAHGARAVPLLALRLVEDSDAPSWRVFSAIFYLGRARDPMASAALLRFVLGAGVERQRHYGAQALREIADPDLASKLRAEQARALALGLPWPAELEALEPAG